MALSDHIELWVLGEPIDVPEDQRGIGSPMCVGCGEVLGTGIRFLGNGAICRSCMDIIRNALWEAMKSRLAEIELEKLKNRDSDE